MKRTLLLTILLICLCFSSCTAKSYVDTFTCDDITNAITDEILGSQAYVEFSDKDVHLMFDDTEKYDSWSVMYSISSDDISEVGILHAKDPQSAEELLEDAIDYVEDLKKEKQEFLRNYLPGELNKLNYADARAFGNYVVYTVLSKDTAEEVFSFVEKMLKE